MQYDIENLLRKHSKCLDDIADHFIDFFRQDDYPVISDRKIKVHKIGAYADLETKKVLKGPGFYLIATDVPTQSNPCRLTVESDLPIVYRGHSYNVRERIESHLFYGSYTTKESARRFSVCMKLDGKNINIDRQPLNKQTWVVVTHSMPKSKILIREAAEVAFDRTFGRPVGSDK